MFESVAKWAAWKKKGTVLTILFCLFACSLVFAKPPLKTLSHPQVIERISREVARPTPNQIRASQLAVNLLAQDEAEAQERGWIKKHPTLFGALVGFGGGYAVGYSGGDDGLINDGGKGTNALIGGGIGAAAGVVIGKFAIH